MSEQLILPIAKPKDMTFANYYAGANGDLIATLQAGIEQNKSGVYYLFGKKGVGKTHLLKACFNQQILNKGSSSYFSLGVTDNLEKVLTGLDPSGLVCIDDLDHLISDRNLEEVIFHLYNQILENEGILILGALQPPKNLNITLPDLISRLSWGLVYNLTELPEEGITVVLHNAAIDIGLIMSVEVVNFLLTRCSRNLADLLNIISILDKASFSEQRKLTIPFVKSVLNI